MNYRTFIAGILGVISGIFMSILSVFYIARKYMVIPHKSSYNFDETVSRMQKAIEKADGWVFPIKEWNFYEAMVKHGKPFKGVDKLTVYFICKATHAQKMINVAPFMASMMPCGWVLYEKNGETFIGTLNINLMAKCFGGTQKQVFQSVADEEEVMLQEIL